MKETLVYQNWEEKVVYPAEGADPQVLAESEKFKASSRRVGCRPENSAASGRIRCIYFSAGQRDNDGR